MQRAQSRLQEAQSQPEEEADTEMESSPRRLVGAGRRAAYRAFSSPLRCRVAVDYTFLSPLCSTCSVGSTNTPYLITRNRLAPQLRLQTREGLSIARRQHLHHPTPHSSSPLPLLVIRTALHRGQVHLLQLPPLAVAASRGSSPHSLAGPRPPPAAPRSSSSTE